MKYLLSLVLLVVSLQFASAQKNGPFKDYYESGELKTEGQYKAGKRFGNWKTYHKNGQVSRNYSYKNGKRDKVYTAYFEDGAISNKTEKIGDYHINFGYYESGKLRYKRQIETGYYMSYYESGPLEIEAEYLNNELIGAWKKYYENGELEWLVTYKEGYREGPYKNFYENGDIKLEGQNSKDKIEGEEIRYFNNNIPEWKGYYSKGVLSKTWTKFDEKGEKIEKIKFKSGLPIDEKFVGTISPTTMADGVFERVPIYPGCEDLLTNTKRRGCMNRSVAMFVNKNFNTDIGSVLPKGRKKILISFKILKTGEVEFVKVKAPSDELKFEAYRVISLLPKMQPGTQRGKPVIVPFTLPVVFQVN